MNDAKAESRKEDSKKLNSLKFFQILNQRWLIQPIRAIADTMSVGLVKRWNSNAEIRIFSV